MKALAKTKSEPGLQLVDVPEPKIGINDVLIRVNRTGICGTDLHIYKWDAWAQKTIPVPMVVGHEFVGEVVQIGSNVNDFHIGDVVSGEGHVVCGRCADPNAVGHLFRFMSDSVPGLSDSGRSEATLWRSDKGVSDRSQGLAPLF
ncbi:MAG: hypothetical protein EXS35_12745, partial [Pedosphaera sp.]|nr:hypothetical protein [Pedosphaera sp.]